MNTEAILEKAIYQAIEGGWNGQPDPYGDTSVNDLIFNKQFAKALWGNAKYLGTNIPVTFEINLEDVPAWQYHLQMMVIADDPIKYLGENL